MGIGVVAAAVSCGNPAQDIEPAPVAVPAAQTTIAKVDSYDYVDPFIGTGKEGKTFPGPSLPFGMIQWSPQTRIDADNRGFYKYDDRDIFGFSLTHLSGVGCPAFGDVPILPLVGGVPLRAAGTPETWTTPLRHVAADGRRLESARPGRYAVQLPSGISAELTVTTRAGIGRFQFPADARRTFLIKAGASVLDLPGREADHSSVEVRGQDLVVGSVSSGGFCSFLSNHTVYFAAKVDVPFDDYGVWMEGRMQPQVRTAQGRRVGAYVTLPMASNVALHMKVGISYVSVANALSNLESEIPGWNFDEVDQAAKRTWTAAMSRLQADGGTEEQKIMLSTSLYHMLLSPNIFHDVSGDYIGFDGQTHAVGHSSQYANFSDWDTYRNTIQLQALLFPSETSSMMDSLVRDAEQSGWLPRWPLANDVTGVMGGDSPSILLSTAHAFGARAFDTRGALKYMLKGALTSGVGLHGYQQRPDGQAFRETGYVPASTHGHSASHTLEYSSADFAIAQFAAAQGDMASCAVLMRSAQNWRNLFDSSIGWIRPRNVDGSFSRDWSGTGEQFGFEEGSTWQYSWMVPHNFAGLIEAMGGNQSAVQKLDTFFSNLNGSASDPRYRPGNEPNFVAPYVYVFAGAPWKTQALMPRILASGFSATPDGLPGDDDLGAMSGVFFWGAVGLYPAIPGVGGFVVGAPMFPRVSITLGNGKVLEIRRSGTGTYVHGLKVNGADYRRAWLPVGLLQKDAVLEFEMGSAPNVDWASLPSEVPPSFGESACSRPAVPAARGRRSRN